MFLFKISDRNILGDLISCLFAAKIKNVRNDKSAVKKYFIFFKKQLSGYVMI